MKHLDYLSNLLKFAFRANPLLYVSILISLFSVVIELLAMSSLMPLFQMVSGGQPNSSSYIARGLMFFGWEVTARNLMWTFILLLAARIITLLASQTLTTYLGRRVMAQLSSQAFAHVMQHTSIQEVGAKSIGYFIGMAGDETFRASVLVIAFTQFIGSGVLIGLYFLAIAHYSLAAAGAVLLFLAISALALFPVLKATHRLGGRTTLESRKSHSIFLDSLNNLKAVRAFSAEKYVIQLYRSIYFQYAKTLFLVDEMSLLTKLVPVLALLVVFSGWLLWSTASVEKVGLAFIITLIVYLMRFFPALGQGVSLLMRIVSDAKAGQDVTSMIAAVEAPQNQFAAPIGVISTITLENITFTYPEVTSQTVLAGVNFSFENGKSYALVGRSGIGKSTLLDLLLKFYTPTDGGLYLNRQPITEVSESDLRSRIVLVNQEAAIFDDSVINNVRMGKEASLEEVERVCRLACIHDVILNMPESYSTRLQYQGSNLSGGQRQRIAIARALLRNPDVLILDESTSALDKSTQQAVIENVLATYTDRIVIFVTHDPQIMQRADVLVDLSLINKAIHHTAEASQATDAMSASALPGD